MRTHSLHNLLPIPVILTAALFALSGCGDTAFDPFEDNAFTYSIFGYLDVSADTQFMRITPVRDSIALSAAPVDARVALENLGTGERTTWNDSLFTFTDDLFERVAYNFWSAQPLTPNATYRLTVTRSDGATSTVMVALPDTFPTPRLLDGAVPFTSPATWRQSILVTGASHLAALDVVYTFRFPDDAPTTTARRRLSYLSRVRETANGLAVAFDAYEDLREGLPGNRCPIVVDATVVVAATTPAWPDFENIDPETLARPDIITNVENGVGFVGGIASQTLPWPAVVGALGARQALCVQRGGR